MPGAPAGMARVNNRKRSRLTDTNEQDATAKRPKVESPSVDPVDRKHSSSPVVLIPRAAANEAARNGTPSKSLDVKAAESRDVSITQIATSSQEPETSVRSQPSAGLSSNGTTEKAPGAPAKKTDRASSTQQSSTPPQASKKDKSGKRKARRRSSNGRGDSALVQLKVQEDEQPSLETKDNKDLEDGDGAVVVVKNGTTQSGTWSLSLPTAGRYIDHDSIFVRDENGDECLIAAKNCEVQILSLSTSLPIRSHAVPDGRTVVCLSRSAQGDDTVDIAYDDGSKEQWLWSLDRVTKGAYPGKENVVALTRTCFPNSRPEVLYVTSKPGQSAIILGRRSLFTTDSSLTAIQALGDTTYIVATGPHAVVIGHRTRPHDTEFVWKQIALTTRLTCVDARMTSPAMLKKGEKASLSLAIGNAKGQIQLFTNLPKSLGTSAPTQLPPPRKLDWHREAVSALKFSHDGNYLISGGRETVLVIWQLETGHKQFLPHLTSEIERIVVSPDGARYALQLGDNSIMVLSTGELKPIAHFAGLQIPLAKDNRNKSYPAMIPRPAVTRGSDHKILLSVASTQPKLLDDISSRPFLQTFDMRGTRHIGRQALCRNNVTDFLSGPEGTRISPPDVHLLAVSADAEWLATVDEWIPPAADLEHIVPRAGHLSSHDVESLREEQERRREVHLKFWHWDRKQEMWALDTRVDSPHKGSDDAGAGRVFDMQASPTSQSFATVGEDQCMRIWHRCVRTYNGTPLRDATGAKSMKWSCKKVTPLPPQPADLESRVDSPMGGIDDSDPTPNPDKPDAVDGCLAFSPDGSLLACSEMIDSLTPRRSTVHLISTRTGEIQVSRPGFVAPEQEVEHVAFHDRYLVTVSIHAFRVWNLVEDRPHYTVTLANVHEDEDPEAPLFAVDHATGTLAFVTKGAGKVASTVQLYNLKKPECIFEMVLTDFQPVAILAAREEFSLLFDNGTIRTLSPSAARSKPLPELPAPTEGGVEMPTTALITLDPAETDSQDASGVQANMALVSDEEASEDDRPVVRPEQLAALFDSGPSFAMPPMSAIFSAVVGLYGRKPRRSIAEMEA